MLRHGGPRQFLDSRFNKPESAKLFCEALVKVRRAGPTDTCMGKLFPSRDRHPVQPDVGGAWCGGVSAMEPSVVLRQQHATAFA